jgi:hypothetical protein
LVVSLYSPPAEACAFLHKEVKPKKGQSLRGIPLKQEPVARQTSDFSNQSPAAQTSASTSRQSSHDVEEQEEDEGSLSLIETRAAVTRSQCIPPPTPSSSTTRPRRAASRAEPEDSPALLGMRDCLEGHQCPLGETGQSPGDQSCKAALHHVHVPVSLTTT